MTEKKVIENELIDLILGRKKDEQVKSTLQLALSIARQHAGFVSNDTIDAIKSNFAFRHKLLETAPHGITCQVSDEPEMFAALLMYFICLEQIGKIFCNPNGEHSGIKRAIMEFGPRNISNSQDLLKGIHNMRNAFAHSFGLINVDKKENPKQKYELSWDISCGEDVVISEPNEPWSDDYTDKSSNTSFTFFAFPFLRMAESIIAEVESRHDRGQLRLAKDIEEIRSRFTILI